MRRLISAIGDPIEEEEEEEEEEHITECVPKFNALISQPSGSVGRKESNQTNKTQQNQPKHMSQLDLHVSTQSILC